MNYLKQLLSSLKCLIYILIEMALVFLITFLYACYNQERLVYYIINHISIISIAIKIKATITSLTITSFNSSPIKYTVFI